MHIAGNDTSYSHDGNDAYITDLIPLAKQSIDNYEQRVADAKAAGEKPPIEKFLLDFEISSGGVDANGKVVGLPRYKDAGWVKNMNDHNHGYFGVGWVRDMKHNLIKASDGEYKMGLKKALPTIDKAPEAVQEAFKSYTFNAGWNQRVLAMLVAGKITESERGELHRDRAKADAKWKEVGGVDMSKIDPEKLLVEMDKIYQNTWRKGEDRNKKPMTYGSTKLRMDALAKRHGLKPKWER